MEFSYINSKKAIYLHTELMNSFGEIRWGLNSQEMLKLALARPRNSAVYENADIIRQTATLYFGLVKNRIRRGGNKRTATVLTKEFLERNGFRADWTLEEIMQLGRNVNIDIWKAREIENLLSDKIKILKLF